jgi:hypothetical protein
VTVEGSAGNRRKPQVVQLADVPFLIREGEETYRKSAERYLTSHQLADFRKSPALYFKKKQGLIEDEDRPAYLVGRAAHALILEGQDEFERSFSFGGPINPKTKTYFGPTSKAYTEWAAAQGKPVLTDAQLQLVKNMAAGVRAHSGASALLRSGQPESVARAHYCGVPSQIRVDWFSAQAGIIDMKSCDDLTWFEADARRFGYAYQLAFYCAVLAAITGKTFPVHLIAIEKKEPFRCGVWLLSDQTLAYCQRENEGAIARLSACQQNCAWPTGYEETRVFDSI